ncbi:MAG: DUF3568 family protein [Deltaproteobacteria bacterium]|nr:DUF3568 family protein [Deltaproteobacteria bacterium]
MLKKLTIMVVLISFVFTGCAPVAFIGGAALGVGGYKYYNGALVVIYKAPFEKIWNASESALENLEYQIFERKRKMTSGKIETAGSIKERVKVSIKYVSLDETEVSIRVGLMGDEIISNKIKDKISEFAFNKKADESE